jgi:membrane protease YdiL (CAAX protease family)
MEDLIVIVLAFLLMLFILMLANLGEKLREEEEPSRLAIGLAYAFVVVLYTAGIFVGLGIHMVGLVMYLLPDAMASSMGGFPETVLDNPTLLAVGIWLPSLIGIVLLLPVVRRLLARVIPIDADDAVHAVALSLSMLIVLNLMVTLGVGLNNITTELAEDGSTDDGLTTIVGLWVQQVMMAVTAAVGVGWLTRRHWTSALKRLGVVIPSGRQALIGFGVGLGLVPLVVLMEWLATLVGVRADPDVERLTEELLGALFESPWGIITLGLAAALGEEPLFRGAAQPRFGLVLTSLLFALLHSQYGITLSTAIVFVLGMVLGLVRIRHNTSTAMITHAVYNISLGLIAYFSLPFLDP